MGVEILEDKPDGNAADQAREIQCATEETSAFGVKAEDRCKQQCQRKLYHRTDHIIQAEFQHIETIVPGENINIIFQPHKFSLADILHIIKAELHHFEKRQVCKQYQQEQRNKQECQRDNHFLYIHIRPLQPPFPLGQSDFCMPLCHVHALPFCVVDGFTPVLHRSFPVRKSIQHSIRLRSLPWSFRRRWLPLRLLPRVWNRNPGRSQNRC